MSNLAVNAILDASGGTTASINGYTPSASNMAGKNKIINGDMRIDQRNAGASAVFSGYTIDRWQGSTSASWLNAQQNAGSVTPPAGFSNYMGLTSTGANSVGTTNYFLLQQGIEGYNIADLGWGTSAAKTITLSFWARSSLTGTFSIVFRNEMGAGVTRTYATTYTISSADTWEKKTITVTGDTAGTWATGNSCGLSVGFGLGIGSSYTTGTTNSWQGANYLGVSGATSVVGTSGATFYITGVQLEVGSTASEFEHRLYGQELALCQRYYERWSATDGSGECAFIGQAISTNQVVAGPFHMKVTKRTSPTITYSSNSHFNFTNATNSSNQTGSLDSSIGNVDSFRLYGSSIATSPLVAGNASFVAANTTSAYIEMSAEL